MSDLQRTWKYSNGNWILCGDSAVTQRTWKYSNNSWELCNEIGTSGQGPGFQRTWKYENGQWVLCGEVCPTASCIRLDVLKRFGLQGEGGYDWHTANFVNEDKLYVPKWWADEFFPGIIGNSPSSPGGDTSVYNTYKLEETIDGVEWYGLENLVRLCPGNENLVAIFRDGNVSVRGTQYFHQWIVDNVDEFKDLFTPSHYSYTYFQALLMNDGRLLRLDLNNPATPPPIIRGLNSDGDEVDLDNIDKVLCTNQAHNCDMIVAGSDDKVWHVGLRGASRSNNWSSAVFGSDGAYGHQIPNLLASDVCLVCMGDPDESGYLVYKGDSSSIYKINFEGNRNLGSFSWIEDVNSTPETLTPFTTNSRIEVDDLLEEGEYFIDLESNEFFTTFLTNRYVHSLKCYNTSSYNFSKDCAYNKFPLPAGSRAVQILTSTAYAMIIEFTTGYYLLSHGGVDKLADPSWPTSNEYNNPCAYSKLERLDDYTNLALALKPNRPDVSLFEFCPSC